MSAGKGVHQKQAPEGSRETIEHRFEGDVLFVGNQETGEVATREAGWVDFYKLKKSTARKLADEFVRRSVELWVESAGVPEHVEAVVDSRLPGIVDKAIRAHVEKVAAEILEEMLREKLTEHLRGELGFSFDVQLKRVDQ